MGLEVFNAMWNNISVISWQSVLLVEETGVPQKYSSKKFLQKKKRFQSIISTSSL
jgi:hypothetical protein